MDVRSRLVPKVCEQDGRAAGEVGDTRHVCGMTIETAPGNAARVVSIQDHE